MLTAVAAISMTSFGVGNTMRDEDVGCESSNGQDACIQKSFSADCAQEQAEVYDNAPYVVGTMVWTLFDYLGEPSGTWPTVISSFGQVKIGARLRLPCVL